MSVLTGAMSGAGTNQSSVTIEIFGLGDEPGSRDRIKGLYSIGGNLSRGSSTNFTISMETLGPLQYAKIWNSSGGTRTFQGTPWYLEKITARHGDKIVTFPHYQWITFLPWVPEVTYADQTLLPQDDSRGRALMRRREVQRKKGRFVWSQDLPLNVTAGITLDSSSFLPRFLPTADLSYDSLHITFKFFEERIQEDQKQSLKSLQTYKKLAADIGRFESIEDFMKFSDLFSDGVKTPEDAWLEDWYLDSEFARQILNGNDPSSIERIWKIPDKIPLSAHHVDGLLHRGLSLDEEVAEGNIYMVDLQILEGIPTGWEGQKEGVGKKLELATPITIFYHSPRGNQLLPLAIQLCQTPGLECPIWTPRDTNEDWAMAKIWFSNAQVHVSSIVSHLAPTHYFVEPFALALRRCLPPAHPVHKLMKEHFKNVVAINTQARERLTSDGGTIHRAFTVGHGSNGTLELLAKAFREFHFDDLHYSDNLRKRDMLDLPGYHHRDDALMLWDAILDYVTDMMDIFYERDADVVDDWELQGWVQDVSQNGFGMIEGAQAPYLGVPQQLRTKQELVMFLQKLIFTTSVRHQFVGYYVFQ